MAEISVAEILSCIGETPLVELKKINKTGCRLFAKLEFLNPSGSIKDRMAYEMVLKAEKRGLLRKGMRIIEVTSGNTGIAFAMIAAERGYKFTAVMPESMTIERRQMISAFGGELVLTPAKDDIAGAFRKFEELRASEKDAWFPMQFENPDNTEAHIKTGNEILRELEDVVDVFVAGVGTGGTLMGVANALRQKNKDVKIVAVEPAESAVMLGRKPGIHQIQGIGEGFIPKLVDMREIDEVVAVSGKDSMAMARRIAREEGMLCGVSSGANVVAALEVGKRPEMKGKSVVTVLPDRGERYLSMNIFSEVLQKG